MSSLRALAILGALLGPLAVATAARAQDGPPDPRLVPPASLHEQVIELPGDPARPVALEVTLYTPAGPGPFPLAVMNHGATGNSNGNRGERYRYTFSAYYFLSRGYAVALPMARGFALSGGDIVHAGCDLVAVGEANARNVAAVIGALARRPEIDARHVVVAGQSFGAWTTLALATMPIAGVHGVVAFSPALRASDCPRQDAAMIAGANRLGAAARIASLWFYGDNDSVVPTPTWEAMFRDYQAGRGTATLVRVGTVGADSHQMLSSGANLGRWTAPADAFLARVGLPAREVHPEYLPSVPPPPSSFAAIDDVAAVPGLSPAGREAYRAFLGRSPPRAFAVGANGDYSAADSGFDPSARAIDLCRRAGTVCRLYAVDGDVVWRDGPAPPRVFARSVPAGLASILNFAFAIDRDCHARGVPAIVVTSPPAHGSAVVTQADGHPRFPPGHPLAGCAAASVPGRIVSYTPKSGFTGTDTLAFEETGVDGDRRSFAITLTVR